MSNVDIQINIEGLNQLRNDKNIVAFCEKSAMTMVNAKGRGLNYDIKSYPARTRGVVLIKPADAHAKNSLRKYIADWGKVVSK